MRTPVESNMAAMNSTGGHQEAKNPEISRKPAHILIFSGKRKSGKDYITDKLYERYFT